MPILKMPLSKTDFDAANWTDAVTADAPSNIRKVWRAYTDAAEQARSSGGEREAEALGFIAIVAGFWLDTSRRDQPFQSELQWSHSRTACGDDLSEDELHLIGELYAEATNHVLRARLADVLWTRKRDHKAAGTAVDAYLASAEKQLDLGEDHHAYDALVRSAQIGLSLGNNPAREKAIQRVLNTFCSVADQGPRTLSLRLIEFLVQQTKEDLQDCIPHVETSIAAARKELLWNEALRLLEVLRVIHLRASNQEEARRCHLRIAETYIAQFESEKGASPLIAANRLERAIEAYRNLSMI